MRCVLAANSPVEAHVALATLEAHGVEAIIQGEHLFSLMGSLTGAASSRPTVWIVNDDEYERARTLLSSGSAESGR